MTLKDGIRAGLDRARALGCKIEPENILLHALLETVEATDPRREVDALKFHSCATGECGHGTALICASVLRQEIKALP